MKTHRKPLTIFLFCLFLSALGLLRDIPTFFKTKVELAPKVVHQPLPNTQSEEEQRNEILATTYLGRKLSQSETRESLIVLTAYLARDTHKVLKVGISEGPDLDQDIQQWEDLARNDPNSRLAHEELGRLYRLKGEQTNDRSWLEKSIAAYTKATKIGLDHGIIRYTRELSEL